MKVPFYPLTEIQMTHKEKLKEAANRVIDSGYYILGEEVDLFEKEFAKYCGVKHCITVANGLEALLLSIMALDLPKDKYILTVANSFIATALAIELAGHKVKLIDCGTDYLIDPKQLDLIDAQQISCVIPVHLYGQMANMKTINYWAKSHGIAVIEDAAQAHGAKRDGISPGELSEAATYSFYPGKNLGALGDGGCVVTNNDSLFEKLVLLRNYGSSRRYCHSIIGYNSRLDEIQAAFLREKLKFLSNENSKRTEIAKQYNLSFSSLSSKGLLSPTVCEGSSPVWHQYVVGHANRSAIMNQLENSQIGSLIHYPIPIHKSEAMAKQFQGQSFPNSEKYADQIFSLPIWPGMNDEQIQHVIGTINSAVQELN